MKWLINVKILILFCAVAIASCDVHEFPQEYAPTIYTVTLEFDTSMVQKIYPYTKAGDYAGTYDMRHTLRVFQMDTTIAGVTLLREPVWEHIFTADVQKGTYNTTQETAIELPDGDYVLQVWSDFVKTGTAEHYFYNPDDMGDITLHAEHKGGTDMREAFRGTASFRAEEKATAQERVLKVNMEMPMAKFEFRATDLKEFVVREYAKTKQGGELTKAKADSIIAHAIEYNKIRFSYAGFMPSSYDIFSDAPSDAKTGVTFDTKLAKLPDGEISMGFDYLFVNGRESTVQVVMAMYDSKGEEVFETNPLEIPVKRGCHSIMKGPFLTIDTRGGVGINPGFDGSFDYIVKF